ncbi:MAG: OmpA family protein [Sedimentisphaerales bacterium]|jgi:chemotaxis protein MotB
MQTKNIICLLVVSFTIALLAGGCNSQQQYDDVKLRNQSQQQRIDELESQLNVTKLKLTQTEKQLAELQASSAADIDALNKKVAALQDDIAKKEELIKKLQASLGGSVLPPELSSELMKFAAENPDMVTFDEATGMVKFKSDLLFDKGSDIVSQQALPLMKKLCEIINSKSAEGFDVSIVGHTDDIPISHAKELHPTNWHLSVHRAISVEKIMESDGLAPTRMSVKGYGEYRPLEANEAGKKGNPKNRRVEIYLVPTGK